MSRESDSSSSAPQGRGGAAYPSGTPPYGSRQYPSLHPQQDAHDTPEADGPREAPKPEEPRTETTLTTRIKINIPGSRPIPPVVVRKTMEGTGGDATAAPAQPLSAKPAPGGPASTPSVQPLSSGAAAGREEARGGRQTNGAGEKTSDWFAPRKSPAPSAGLSAETSSGSGTVGGSGAGTPPFGTGHPAPDGSVGNTGPIPAYGTGTAAPAGPTTGPAEGDMHLLPPAFRQPPPPAPQSGGPSPADDYSRSPYPPPGGPYVDAPGAGPDQGYTPAGPGQDTAAIPTPEGGFGADPGPGPEGAFASGADADRVSGDTLVSGIPVVPPSGHSPFPAAPGDEEGSAAPVPPPPAAASAPPRAAAKKKGRSKLVLLGAAVVTAAAIAYGTGLLLDHSEVPKGTTVLGVGIGGMTKEKAVETLDSSLATRRTAPLEVAVGGDEQQLKPSVAGLGIDTETTVRNAAGRDYNPVSVIGSLFGGAREAEPEFKIDNEKLTAALKGLAGSGGGAAKDGTIKFVNGKAIPVEGVTHKAIDVDKSVAAVSEAYRTRAAGASTGAVELPSGMQKPAVGKAEIDRAMREFARPAMSGLVTVRTDAAHTISFSPDKSLPKFLSMRAVNGKLVEYFDRAALKRLYGGVFDGVLVQRGDGSKTPVTPEDVIQAMRPALTKTDPAARVGVIETNGS